VTIDEIYSHIQSLLHIDPHGIDDDDVDIIEMLLFDMHAKYTEKYDYFPTLTKLLERAKKKNWVGFREHVTEALDQLLDFGKWISINKKD
jgi:hypothetical protein